MLGGKGEGEGEVELRRRWDGLGRGSVIDLRDHGIRDCFVLVRLRVLYRHWSVRMLLFWMDHSLRFGECMCEKME